MATSLTEEKNNFWVQYEFRLIMLSQQVFLTHN